MTQASADTDTAWQLWGERDPYFGVLTDAKFRSAHLTPEVKAEFFKLGQYHADYVLNSCRQHFGASFSPRRILDFGCGVGRVAIPFAKLAEEVVGTDIALSMLKEAQRNCEERSINNLELVLSDDHLSSVHGKFDLVHSCIVLQHIEEGRGRAIFERLVDRIAPRGCGAIQLTVGWDFYASTYGRPPLDAAPPAPTAVSRLKTWLSQLSSRLGGSPPRHASSPRQRQMPTDPEMQMNYYNLSELTFILQRAGVGRIISDSTNHGGVHGVFLFFQR